MMLIVAGAGASYDSVPARPPSLELDARPPLADQLFDSREYFLGQQRAFPAVLQVAAQLSHRQQNQSVEDVLEVFSGQQKDYPERLTQLAAMRYYIQSIIAGCESSWVASAPVSTNMHTLVDRIEAVRRGRERPVFVTFNYDRLIERALEYWGQGFNSLDAYIDPGAIRVIKLHGSADWCRLVSQVQVNMEGGNPLLVINEICRSFRRAELGPIEMGQWTAPLWRIRDQPVIPAIAVPLKKKSTFECPDKHLDALRAVLPRVDTILTIGWRGAEEHFLDLLREHVAKPVEVLCIGGTEADAKQTAAALRSTLHGRVEHYGQGFSEFLRAKELERLLNCTWI